MELWIRSQDKRILQKVDNVYLNANYENKRICTNDSRDYESDLGEYKSKERALEILDEIQDIISFMVCKEVMNYDAEQYMQFDYETLKEIENKGLVYEMPKE